MTDKGVECIRKLQAFAEEHGAVIERIEATLLDNGRGVGFTAILTPRPLKKTFAAVGYAVDE